MFSDKDIEQIKSKGLDISTVHNQLENFRRGFPFVNLASPATVEHGIKFITESQAATLEKAYDQRIRGREVVKFIPASGAATRMFKHLFEFRDAWNSNKAQAEQMLTDRGFNSVYYFFEHLDQFAFMEDLQPMLIEGGSHDKIRVLDLLLEDSGLGYASLPKALLKFHRYRGEPARTALEEHYVEAAYYSITERQVASLHFTVSPEHMEKFRANVTSITALYEQKLGVRFETSFSIQKPSTDVIAVNPDNTPFREKDGSLLFRPGGHGALIENLNDIKADIVFIKNIDNVVPDWLKAPTVRYKKVLGALLLEYQREIFSMLVSLDNERIKSAKLDEMAEFCGTELFISLPPHFRHLSYNEKVDVLRQFLNRPIRVCGMVKNVGEPGGGPFWVRDKDGNLSLQIIESSQINLNDPGQRRIFNLATHFNPVDLVCGLRDYKGNNFNLLDYVDPETGFISTKSKDGKELKAQELPGLWNGAMAHWNTIFVEVPLITFNPVKTINDLLRKEHLLE